MSLKQTEPPLQPEEIEAWLDGLGTTRAARIVLLKELIRYANGDHMSAEDRVICVDALHRLQQEERKAQGLPPLAIIERPKTKPRRWPGAQKTRQEQTTGARSSNTGPDAMAGDTTGVDQSAGDGFYSSVPATGADEPVSQTIY